MSKSNVEPSRALMAVYYVSGTSANGFAQTKSKIVCKLHFAALCCVKHHFLITARATDLKSEQTASNCFVAFCLPFFVMDGG